MTGADDAITVVRVRVSGRVQGVWYRGGTVERARLYGLAGWVRNRADGSVEALFAGMPGAVDAMVAECRAGPPAARVRELAVSPDSFAGSGFEQRPTV